MVRRTNKSRAKQKGINAILIPLGTLFSVIMFIVKLIGGNISWIEVFAPLLITLLIVFVISALKTAIRRV